MALVIPMVTITGGINPLNKLILKPRSAMVPIVQITTTPIMIIEKITALTERKNMSMIRPVTMADRYKKKDNSLRT